MPYADLKKLRLYYEVMGEGDPLLVLNGWSLVDRTFPHQIELFAEEFACIRVDYRGMGRSDAPDTDYRIADIADDLADLVEELDLDQVRLLGGGTMGALVAMELAIRHPRSIRSLVVGGGMMKADNFFREQMQMWGELYKLDKRLWAREVTLWCFTPESYNRDPEMVKEAERARAEEDLFVAPWAVDRTVAAFVAHDVTGRLGHIKCPTLITCGGHQDNVAGARFSDILAQQVAGAEMYVSEGAGHFNWEEDKQWGTVVREWLRTH